jgi:hypothetical protein
MAFAKLESGGSSRNDCLSAHSHGTAWLPHTDFREILCGGNGILLKAVEKIQVYVR